MKQKTVALSWVDQNRMWGGEGMGGEEGDQLAYGYNFEVMKYGSN